MQKIAILRPETELLEHFLPGPCFKSAVPFLPDDVLASGYWQETGQAERQSMHHKIVPALVFFCNGKVLTIKTGKKYRLWFGDPIFQDEILSYTSCDDLVRRTIKKERIRAGIPYDFIGYCTDKRNWYHNEFLIVYTAILEKKQLLKNEIFIPVKNIPQIYFKLEPLSKKLFDVFYETPDLYRRYLFKKTEKNN